MKIFHIFAFFILLTQLLAQATNITNNDTISSENKTISTNITSNIQQDNTKKAKTQPKPKKVEDNKNQSNKQNSNNQNKNATTEKNKKANDKKEAKKDTKKKEEIKKEEVKKDEKPFNLTESLINFFMETFGNKNNKTNDTEQKDDDEDEKQRQIREQEKIKKLTEERERKRKAEQEKNAKLEKIKIENDKKKEKLKKFEEDHNNFIKIISNNTFEEVIQINLEKGEKETLYMDLESFSKIKLAVAVSDKEEEEKINFFFSGPNARGRTSVLYQLYGKNFLFWEYETLRKGEYFAEIINKGTKDNEIYFLFNNQNKKKDVLNTEKIDKISMLLNNIDTNINQLRNKKKIEIKQVNSHNDKVTNNNKWIVYYSIIEIITMIMVFMIQSCYINSLVNKV
jgi:hypothetical protein